MPQEQAFCAEGVYFDLGDVRTFQRAELGGTYSVNPKQGWGMDALVCIVSAEVPPHDTSLSKVITFILRKEANPLKEQGPCLTAQIELRDRSGNVLNKYLVTLTSINNDGMFSYKLKHAGTLITEGVYEGHP
jgi:hypothetical protein